MLPHFISKKWRYTTLYQRNDPAPLYFKEILEKWEREILFAGAWAPLTSFAQVFLLGREKHRCIHHSKREKERKCNGRKVNGKCAMHSTIYDSFGPWPEVCHRQSLHFMIEMSQKMQSKNNERERAKWTITKFVRKLLNRPWGYPSPDRAIKWFIFPVISLATLWCQ